MLQLVDNLVGNPMPYKNCAAIFITYSDIFGAHITTIFGFFGHVRFDNKTTVIWTDIRLYRYTMKMIRTALSFINIMPTAEATEHILSSEPAITKNRTLKILTLKI